MAVEIDRGRIAEPALCRNCNTNHSMVLVHNRSQYTDKQITKLQESPGTVAAVISHCICYATKLFSLVLCQSYKLMQASNGQNLNGIFHLYVLGVFEVCLEILSNSKEQFGFVVGSRPLRVTCENL